MIFWGNALSLLGCCMMVAIGLVKKKEKVLVYQCVQFTFMGLGNLVLGAVSGTVANLVGIVRNLVFAKTRGSAWLKLVLARIKDTVWLKLLFIAIQAGYTATSWSGRAIELLPVLTTVLFVTLLNSDSGMWLKLLFIAVQAGFTIAGWSGRVIEVLPVSAAVLFVALLDTKRSAWQKLLFIVIQVGFTAVGWNGRAIEVLPILATVLFVAFLDTKSDLTFKAVNMACMVLWATYDWTYHNYVAFTCDILTIVSSGVALVGLVKKKEASRRG